METYLLRRLHIESLPSMVVCVSYVVPVEFRIQSTPSPSQPVGFTVFQDAATVGWPEEVRELGQEVFGGEAR